MSEAIKNIKPKPFLRPAMEMAVKKIFKKGKEKENDRRKDKTE